MSSSSAPSTTSTPLLSLLSAPRAAPPSVSTVTAVVTVSSSGSAVGRSAGGEGSGGRRSAAAPHTSAPSSVPAATSEPASATAAPSAPVPAAEHVPPADVVQNAEDVAAAETAPATAPKAESVSTVTAASTAASAASPRPAPPSSVSSVSLPVLGGAPLPPAPRPLTAAAATTAGPGPVTANLVPIPPSAPPSVSASASTVPRPAGPPPAPPVRLQPTLPSASAQRHITEARQALDASIANLLDNRLQDRAVLMHSNMRAIAGQQRDLDKSVTGLRKANDGLAQLVHDVTGPLKEMGHLQNWAEMQFQGLLTIQDTLRQVRERRARDGARREARRATQREQGGDDNASDSGSYSGSYSDSGSYSGSYTGSSRAGSRSRSRSRSRSQQRSGAIREEADKGLATDAVSGVAGLAAARTVEPIVESSGVDAEVVHQQEATEHLDKNKGKGVAPEDRLITDDRFAAVPEPTEATSEAAEEAVAIAERTEASDKAAAAAPGETAENAESAKYESPDAVICDSHLAEPQAQEAQDEHTPFLSETSTMDEVANEAAEAVTGADVDASGELPSTVPDETTDEKIAEEAEEAPVEAGTGPADVVAAAVHTETSPGGNCTEQPSTQSESVPETMAGASCASNDRDTVAEETSVDGHGPEAASHDDGKTAPASEHVTVEDNLPAQEDPGVKVADATVMGAGLVEMLPARQPAKEELPVASLERGGEEGQAAGEAHDGTKTEAQSLGRAT